MSSSVALLLSGGMDSATCLWWLIARGVDSIHTISVDYHQRHRIELEFAVRLATGAGVQTHKRLDLTSSGGNPLTSADLDVPAAHEDRQTATVVPFRNMLFVTAAAAYAAAHGICDLYIAPVKDDYRAYRDCRREFYDSLETSLQLGAPRDRPFRLHTPFVDKWKKEVIELGLELGVPYAFTHTCYTGRRPACGLCDACTERIEAFKANKVRDPLDYEIDITWP